MLEILAQNINFSILALKAYRHKDKAQVFRTRTSVLQDLDLSLPPVVPAGVIPFTGVQMATGRKPDPRKRKTVHQHSEYLPVPNKTKAGGWKAGEVYGLYCHHAGHTRPCLDDVTKGALECPLCTARFDLIYRAYMPLWDREYQLRHVLIGEDFFEAADRIPFRHPLTLARDANKRSPLRVSDEPMMVRVLPDGPPWDKPVDMLSICLTLWKDDVLSKWMVGNRAALEDVKKETPLKSDGRPFGPMTAAAARRFAPPPTVESAEVALDEVTARLKKKAAGMKPSTNGNGKHGTEGGAK